MEGLCLLTEEEKINFLSQPENLTKENIKTLGVSDEVLLKIPNVKQDVKEYLPWLKDATNSTINYYLRQVALSKLKNHITYVQGVFYEDRITFIIKNIRILIPVKNNDVAILYIKYNQSVWFSVAHRSKSIKIYVNTTLLFDIYKYSKKVAELITTIIIEKGGVRVEGITKQKFLDLYSKHLKEANA